MPERAPQVSPSTAPPGSTSPSTLPTRNRRTAVVLVAWIFVLMMVSVLVAWFRN